MAHAASVENGIVSQVIVVPDGADADYCASIGLSGTWVLTSYDGSTRGKYAAIGDTYDGTDFIPPPVVEDPVAAYSRGKTDGITETTLLYQQPEVM